MERAAHPPIPTWEQRAGRAAVRRVAEAGMTEMISTHSIVCVYIDEVYMSIPVSQLILHFSSPLGSHTFILYIFVSISALSINSSVPFF